MSRFALPFALLLALTAPAATQPQPAPRFEPIKPPEWVRGITRMTFGSPGEVEKAAAVGAHCWQPN